MSAPDVSRQVVEFLGRPAMWRGVVFGGAGVFLVVAAASSGPDQAQGLDGSLCKIATTPLGPDSALAALVPVPAVRLVGGAAPAGTAQGAAPAFAGGDQPAVAGTAAARPVRPAADRHRPGRPARRPGRPVNNSNHGIVHDLHNLFAISIANLYVAGAAIAC